MTFIRPSAELEKGKEKEKAAVFHIYSELGKEYNTKKMEKEYLKWVGSIYSYTSPKEINKILKEKELTETANLVVRDFLDTGQADKAEIETIGKLLDVKYLVISEVFKFRTKSLFGYEERIGLGVASLDVATGEISWQVFDSIGQKSKSKTLMDKIAFGYKNIKFLKKSSELQGREKAAIEDINRDNKKSYFSSQEMLTVKRQNYLSLGITSAPAPFATYESRMLRTIYPSMTWIAFTGNRNIYGKTLENKLGGGIEINYLQYLDLGYYINADGQAITSDVSIPFSFKGGTKNISYVIGIALSDPKEELKLAQSKTIYNRIYWMNPVIDLNVGYGYVFQGNIDNPFSARTEVSDQVCYGIDLIYPSKMYKSSFNVDLAVTSIYFKNWIVNGLEVSDSERNKIYIVPALRLLGNVQIMFGKQIKGGKEYIYSVSFSIIH